MKGILFLIPFVVSIIMSVANNDVKFNILL